MYIMQSLIIVSKRHLCLKVYIVLESPSLWATADSVIESAQGLKKNGFRLPETEAADTRQKSSLYSLSA